MTGFRDYRKSPLGSSISRRDFCNGVLVGTGAALLPGCRPAENSAAEPISVRPGWDGPSGIGEYRGANGNTWRTTQAGHAIRDGVHFNQDVRDIGEHYDLIVVGGGFGGLGALREFVKERPGGRALLLDNQEILGGYAKANQFEVDGHMLAGAQASLNFVVPQSADDRGGELWTELGLPFEFDFAQREDGGPQTVFSASSSGALYAGEQSATTGYHFGSQGWVADMWEDNLSRAPFDEATKQSLLALRGRKRAGVPEGDEARRLDALTFEEFARDELEATPEAISFITTGMCITGPKISAYGARALPGLERYPAGSPGAAFSDRFVSFPSGNTVLARGLAKLVAPQAFSDGDAGQQFGKLDPSTLDQSPNAVRIRSRATVFRVENVPGKRVEVDYWQDGTRHRVTADGVVVTTGAWVTKHIVKQLDAELATAFAAYHYSPILMANVALRNWRFLDRLGISAARWFDGTGFYCNVRKPMIWQGKQLAPFHPDKPIVMTVYIPFPRPDLPLQAGAASARMELYDTPFETYERRLVSQLEQMFSGAGFVAARDVAGIVLNRWGHAFVTPPPGFFFGEGALAPVDAMAERHGRIAFGQNGLEDWFGAVEAGQRATRSLLAD